MTSSLSYPVPARHVGALLDGDGEVRAMQFAEPASNAHFRILNNRFSGFVAADDTLGAESAANTAGLAPVLKNAVLVSLFYSTGAGGVRRP